MKITAAFLLAIALGCAALVAQETKPVPKDSVRLSIPGCTRGYVFTAGPRNSDQPGSFEIPEGMHLRMNGDKKLMAEIKAHEGSMVEITGLMKKSQVQGRHQPRGRRANLARPRAGRRPRWPHCRPDPDRRRRLAPGRGYVPVEVRHRPRTR